MAATRKHGYSGTRVYATWTQMRQRHSKQVGTRWLVFDYFLEDMGDQPKGFKLARKDLAKGFYKENCEWVEKTNKSAMFTVGDVTMTVSMWAKKSGLSAPGILNRRRLGYTDEQCVTNYGTYINNVMFLKEGNTM